MTKNSDVYSTPHALFNELDREFHFTLDACADEKNHKCDRYFTEEDNGLLQSWGGGRRYGAILPIRRLGNGCRKLMRSHGSQTRLWSCCYLLPLHLPGSTITSCTGLRSATFNTGCILETAKHAHRLRQ